MNIKYILFLVVVFTGVYSWGSRWDVAAFCQGVVDKAACISRYVGLVEAPAAQKKPLDVGDKRLLDAVKDEDAEAVSEALQNRVSVNAHDRFGFTALMKAAMAKNKKKGEEIAQILIANGANVEQIDNTFGRTALMYAVEYGNGGVVTLLIQAGADVNRRDKVGKTALWYANNYVNPSEETNKAKGRIIEMLNSNGAVE